MKFKLIVIFLLFLSANCNSQVQGNQSYDYKKETTYIKDNKVVNKEKFDTTILDKLEDKEGIIRGGYIGKEYVTISLRPKYIYYSITPKSSYFSDVKIYDPHTNQIKEEGKIFDSGSWRLGIWSFYDKDGKLEKKINYDEPFIFTLDDIFEYCEKHEIVIPFLRESGRNKIERTFIEGKPCWIINSYKHGWLTRVTLDGRTGKEIDRLEGQLY